MSVYLKDIITETGTATIQSCSSVNTSHIWNSNFRI